MSEENNETIASVQEESKCHDCGAVLQFEPGTRHLKCQYCGAENEIAPEAEKHDVEETDLLAFLSENNIADDQKEQVLSVKCTACGASSSLQPNVVSDQCSFCDTPLVVSNANTNQIIKPKYLLPFVVKDKEALEQYKKWVKGRWFAPSDLIAKADNPDKIKGLYIPYWTYDTDTRTEYDGSRGHYRTEHYTVEVNGKTETRSRTVTDWYPCSGTVYVDFNDILVLASNNLPEKYAARLDPWDLSALVPYDSKYLSGFRSEIYQVDLITGFEKVKVWVQDEINNAIKRDIGGDTQRIFSYDTQHRDISFKHILLPIWISSFNYNGKIYRFMINGQTGEVQGERPWSWIKIVGTILLGVGIVVGMIYLFNKK